MSATLRVLIHIGDGDDPIFLGWVNPPAAAYIQGRDLFGEINFGDEECADIPVDCPEETGLWLLTWEYEHVPVDDWTGLAMETVYAETCSWTRPTLDDLVALGALPQVAP